MNGKKIIGYTTGVFDLFHIGHLNILKRSKEQCDYLIVGVTVDDLVAYKNKKAAIPFEERIEIVRSIKYVDMAVPQITMDKIAAWEKYRFNKMFVGSDWKNTKRWLELERHFESKNVEIVYFPYTVATSSTLLKDALMKLINEQDIAT